MTETKENQQDPGLEEQAQAAQCQSEENGGCGCQNANAEWEGKLNAAQEKEKVANEKYLRLYAEFENYRRRTAREQLELIETANAKLLERLSEVADNFDRALTSPKEGSDPEAFAKGVQLIGDQFFRILGDFGLETINPVGEEFDPNSQEALLKQPSADTPENHILQVFQKGYRLKNKVIKTAKVIVSAGPAA